MAWVVERVRPGRDIGHTLPGDFILTHRKSLYGRLVSVGQRLRFVGEDRPFAHWTHTALVTGYEGQIIEAVSAGVRVSSLEDYKDTEYHYVHTKMYVGDRRQAVKFAESCLGQKYAWISIVSLAITCLFNTRWQFGRVESQFCSELVARSLERGDFIFQRPPAMMMPAHLAQHFGVTPKQAVRA